LKNIEKKRGVENETIFREEKIERRT